MAVFARDLIVRLAGLNVLVLVMASSSAIFAQAVLPETAQQEIVKAVEDFRNQQHVPGISVAIGIDDEIAFQQGFGVADLENDVAAAADTAYRTASIAKPVTATAVMQLVEKGKLQLDDSIHTHCPEFPEKDWPITIRQLLCHQSGVRHYVSSEESAGKTFYPTIAASIAIFADDPLRHEPGTDFTYSTFAYSLLGRAVETASGQPFWQYLQENVFQPAGMDNSGVDHTRMIIPRRAEGYVYLNEQGWRALPEEIRALAQPNQHYNAELHDTSMKIPGGGLISTAPDLVRFGQAWIGSELVNANSVAQAWAEQQTSSGEETGYGLGWGVAGEGDERRVSHSGGQAGTSTFLLVMPEQRLVVAVMCNLQSVPCGNLAQTIARTVIGAENR